MPNPMINENGDKHWYVDGKLHRIDGPAIERINGTKAWFVDGFRHRINGPAIEFLDGTKQWYVNDKLHRLDGPAVEYPDGDKSWYAYGKNLSGPLELIKHDANWKDLAEWLTPREIAQIKLDK